MANITIQPFGTGTVPSTNIGIVNDLKTGGADKALAAEQGKNIDKDLYERIEIPLDDYGYALGSIYGSTYPSTNKHRMKQIKVNPGEVYELLANETTNSYYAFLTERATWVASGNPPFCEGYGSVISVTKNTLAVFTIPEDCEYLFIAWENRTTSPATYIPQGLWLRRKFVESQKVQDDRTKEFEEGIEGEWEEHWDYETAEVSSNASSIITIEKVEGKIVVTNKGDTGGSYAGIVLPSTLVNGKTYKVTIEYAAGFSKASTWYFAFANSSYTATSGGLSVAPFVRKKVTFDYTHSASNVYMRFAATSQNTGAKVTFYSISFSTEKPTLTSLDARIKELESGSGSTEMENMLRQAKYAGSSPSKTPLALLHFTDIHGDSAAAAQIVTFFNKYSDYIDDMVQTGDAVYYYYNSSGQGADWFRGNDISKSLFVLGNHDGAADVNGTWREGSADWDYKGKEWDFDTYFADFISVRGVTHPEGYDDEESPYYKACYWHKDYASAKVRVIGIDCMHFNDTVRYTANDQETWLAAKLQETLTSGNAAYGYSVVFLCHYALDDYSGANETWNDTNHRFTFNKNSGGGHVMDANTQRAVNCHYGSSYTAEKQFCMREKNGSAGLANYTKGSTNPIGDIINTWRTNGGKYLAWLSGHTHTEYMYYPAKYPNMLVIGLPQAGNTRGTGAADRSTASAMHTCANVIVFDTENECIKIIRVGKTLDKRLMRFEKLCYDYSEKTVTR